MKNTKKILSLVLCLIMAVTAVACGSSSAPAATNAPAEQAPAASETEANPNARVLKWSANSPAGYPDYESAMRIKAYVEEQTNGEIILEVYPDNILGDWTVVFDEIMNGGIDEQWDSYLNELDAMRLTRLMEINQAAYDRYIGK